LCKAKCVLIYPINKMYAIPEKITGIKWSTAQINFNVHIKITKNKWLQVQSRVVFIMNEHFNNYNPWWTREDIAFCSSCPCCFADRPRIHTDFSLIPRCDNPWKDVDFAFSLWTVL
jgi:hypothetical protein